MTVHTLFFEPQDVLLFKDHRSFDGGLHASARTMFPPPSTFLGALRSALVPRCGGGIARDDFGLTGDNADWLGTKRKPGTLQLHGPVLARRTHAGAIEPLPPAPRDLGGQVFAPEDPLQPRHWTRRRRIGDGAPVVVWRDDPSAHKRSGLQWLTGAEASDWLDGRAVSHPADPDVKVREQWMAPELRVGIQRDVSTRAVRESMFYVAPRWRLADGFGYGVEVEAPAHAELDERLLDLDGVRIPLGGKGHRARITVVPRTPLFPAPKEAERVKLWLLTPLVVEDTEGGSTLDPLVTHLVTAATDRGHPAGGFDVAQKGPKPLSRTLPEGTVLYTNLDLASITARWSRGARIHLGNEATCRAGWGLALCGGWTR